MKEREQKELINLLKNFNKELECYGYCGDCEYGILRGYGDSWSCPLVLVQDMVYNKFNNNELWKDLIGYYE